MRHNPSAARCAPGLVVRAVNKPHHSVTARAGTYALAHLTLLKQRVSAVCRTAMFVPLHKGAFNAE